MTKTRRNSPCSCGSGRKYKKCCYQKDEKKDRTLTQDDYLAISNKFTDKLIRFLMKPQFMDDVMEGWKRLFGDIVPAYDLSAISDYDIIQFHDYMIHCYRLMDENQTVVATFYEKYGDGLRTEEAEILQNLMQGLFSLFKIEDVFKFEGAVLVDLFDDKEYELMERIGTDGLEEGSVIAAHICKIGSKYMVTGNMIFFHDDEVEGLQSKILSEFHKMGGSDFKTFLKDISFSLAPVGNDFNLPPILKEEEGIDEIFSIIYEIIDYDSLLDFLGNQPYFDLPFNEEDKNEEDEFMWYMDEELTNKTRDRGSDSVFSTLFASGTMNKDELEIVAISENRKKIIEDFFETHCGKWLKLINIQYQNLSEILHRPTTEDS